MNPTEVPPIHSNGSAPPAALLLAANGDAAAATASPALPRGQKRPRDSSATPLATPAPPPSAHAPQSSTPRRIESVVFGGYEITTSYSSPYPFEDSISSGGGAGAGGGGAGAGEGKRALGRESSGRFGSKVAGEGKGKKVVAANGRRKSSLATAKSITPELFAPPTATSTSAVKDEEEEREDAAAGPSSERIDLDVVEDSEAGSPAPQDSSASLTTEASEQAVASSLIPQGDSTLPPNPAPAHPLATSHPSAEPSADQPPPAIAHNALPPPSPSAALARGQAGRFLPKPAGSSIRAQRQLEKASRAAAAALAPAPPADGVDLPPPTRHLTVREQREVNKRAREERDREAAVNGQGQGHMTTKRLFVCEGCFKYMLEENALKKHSKECKYTRPPGKKVYQRGAHTIYEVDGAVEKLYCQNLCLFGKLFIEHKYMFFDVEGFVFYIITDATPSRDWPIAYFSKEKVSYDDYNLACIVTFPQYRQKGWATLLIEFSYEITRRTSPTPGTPERPLSALGMKGYLAYWTGVLIRYFRAIFEHQGEPPPLITQPAAGSASPEQARKGKARRSRGGFDGELLGSQVGGSGLTVSLKRDAGGLASAALVPSSTRRTRGGVDEGGSFRFPTSLKDVAEATNIRPDDAAFALVESGLAQWRRPVGGGDMAEDSTGAEGEEGEKVLELVISKELVEKVALEKGVKESPMLDLAYVLL